jgi:hypothetical protein
MVYGRTDPFVQQIQFLIEMVPVHERPYMRSSTYSAQVYTHLSVFWEQFSTQFGHCQPCSNSNFYKRANPHSSFHFSYTPKKPGSENPGIL